MLSKNLVPVSLQCVVLPQLPPSDEVTSEEEEEEEMGEVFVSVQRAGLVVLRAGSNRHLSTGSRTLTWTKTWTIMT